MKLFVYGTLKRGFANNSFYLKEAEFVSSFCLFANYKMVNLGSFPALIKSDTPEFIYGEIYEVDQITMANIDKLEGYPGFYSKETFELKNELVYLYYLDRPECVYPEVYGNEW